MNNEQFATYLFRGLGRTYLYLQQHDSSPYHEALLHACLYNPVYDRQCEGSRAAYLLRLVTLTDVQPLFEQYILDAFMALNTDMDVEQLFDFALRYAQAGNQKARRLMYEQFAAHAGDGTDIGATQLIDLDGVEGFRFVAARLGEAARLDPEFWDTDDLVTHLKEQLPNITDADIVALGRSDSSIQAYLAVVAQTMTRRAQASLRRKNTPLQPYSKLKAQLATGNQAPYGHLRRWGKSAHAADIDAAARDLLKQDDPRLLACYLAIFIKRQFPLGIQPLLPLIRHSDERVAWMALEALSLFRDPTLRDIGLALLGDNGRAHAAVGLFNLNYETGDEQMFISLLDGAQADEDVHAIGFGLVDVLYHNNIYRSPEILVTLYERQPCSRCRKKVVALLAEMKAIPEWMRHECHYDANEDTCDIVLHYKAES